MNPPHRMVSSLLLAASALAAFSPGAQAQGRAARDLPYATSFVISMTSGSAANGYSPDAIPSTKRLVIEYVSVIVTAQPGERPSLSLYDSVNNYGHAYWIPLALIQPGTNAGDVYGASQLVKIYHDGNGTGGPGAICGRGANSFTPLTCHLTISGYLVDK